MQVWWRAMPLTACRHRGSDADVGGAGAMPPGAAQILAPGCQRAALTDAWHWHCVNERVWAWLGGQQPPLPSCSTLALPCPSRSSVRAVRNCNIRAQAHTFRQDKGKHVQQLRHAQSPLHAWLLKS